MNKDELLSSLEHTFENKLKPQKYILKLEEETDFDKFFYDIREMGMLSSSTKIQSVIQALLLPIRYKLNSNFYEKIINNFIAKINDSSFEQNISLDHFLQAQIDNFAREFNENQSKYTLKTFHTLYFVEEIETSLLNIIQKDDVVSFQEYLIQQPHLNFSLFEMPNFFHFTNTERYQNSYVMEFAAYFGASKIFRFLYINKEAKYGKYINCYAVASCNAEIVHICESLSDNYTGCVLTAIKFHRNEILEWLITNKNLNVDIECLLISIQFHNYEAFIRIFELIEFQAKYIHQIIEFSICAFEPKMLKACLIASNVEKNEQIYRELNIAVKISSFKCIKVLLEYFTLVDGNSLSELFMNSIKYSSIEISELLDQKYNINYNYQDQNGRTALHDAVRKNNLEKVDYLLNKKGININTKDNESVIPLLIAAQKGYTEIVERLLQNSKIRLKAYDDVLPIYLIMLINPFKVF
ncbi:hypothetical protein TRFO_37169 [Tritrichomonas foetus]|uniref:DUF3447 domain-containing protein n=1 Tax=Tritrichomonas foetus TaxID=1144522 RepID=A0A1J4JEA6_9EUKA|nr:hypothetical protein TRFO_37169 [Tritrichomonas foetus]|eukprot:OHS96623.1 hypothetical protein TRFO_37169 [Tritrichomonas foetus]